LNQESSASPDGAISSEVEVHLRIIAPTEVIEALASVLQREGLELSCSSVFDASYLGLDFSTAADLATILSTTLISDPLIPALARWFGPKAKARRIVVETPLGRVTLDTRDELTTDEIRERLAQVIRLL
jgi:hypothetical protein